MDISESIAAQARQLWAHLPADEVGDDEELLFRTDSAGNLLVVVPATGCNYRFREGVAWRVQRIPDGFEVSVWQRRERIACRLIMREELSAPWN